MMHMLDGFAARSALLIRIYLWLVGIILVELI